MPDSPDPSPQGFDFPSLWRPVSAMLSAVDEQIAEVYKRHSVAGVRPRFSMSLIILDREGPISIRALARKTRVSHSAMSQTIAAMKESGLVTSRPGPDARTQLIELDEAGRTMVPFLEAEWLATEAALTELEQELPYPLSQLVGDIEEALRRKSFADRIDDHLPDAIRAER